MAGLTVFSSVVELLNSSTFLHCYPYSIIILCNPN